MYRPIDLVSCRSGPRRVGGGIEPHRAGTAGERGSRFKDPDIVMVVTTAIILAARASSRNLQITSVGF